MGEIKKIQRKAIIVAAFILGMLTNKAFPEWMVVIVPTLIVGWLIAYDFATGDYNEARHHE